MSECGQPALDLDFEGFAPLFDLFNELESEVAEDIFAIANVSSRANVSGPDTAVPSAGVPSASVPCLKRKWAGAETSRGDDITMSRTTKRSANESIITEAYIQDDATTALPLSAAFISPLASIPPVLPQFLPTLDEVRAKIAQISNANAETGIAASRRGPCSGTPQPAPGTGMPDLILDQGDMLANDVAACLGLGGYGIYPPFGEQRPPATTLHTLPHRPSQMLSMPTQQAFSRRFAPPKQPHTSGTRVNA